MMTNQPSNLAWPVLLPTCTAGGSGLQREDAEGDGKIYALLLADTVVVKAGGGPPDVATALAPKDWKEVAYHLVGGCLAFPAGE